MSSGSINTEATSSSSARDALQQQLEALRRKQDDLCRRYKIIPLALRRDLRLPNPMARYRLAALLEHVEDYQECFCNTADGRPIIFITSDLPIPELVPRSKGWVQSLKQVEDALQVSPIDVDAINQLLLSIESALDEVATSLQSIETQVINMPEDEHELTKILRLWNFVCEMVQDGVKLEEALQQAEEYKEEIQNAEKKMTGPLRREFYDIDRETSASLTTSIHTISTAGQLKQSVGDMPRTSANSCLAQPAKPSVRPPIVNPDGTKETLDETTITRMCYANTMGISGQAAIPQWAARDAKLASTPEQTDGRIASKYRVPGFRAPLDEELAAMNLGQFSEPQQRSTDTKHAEPSISQTVSFKRYQEAWDALSSHDPLVPFPSADLQYTSLETKHQYHGAGSMSRQARARAKAVLFFLQAFDIHHNIDAAHGAVEVRISTLARGENVTACLDHLRLKEKRRWHPDQLNRRVGNESGGVDESIGMKPEMKVVWDAVSEVERLCKKFLGLPI